MKPHLLPDRSWFNMHTLRFRAAGVALLLAVGLAGYAISGATAGTGPSGSAGRTGPPAAAAPVTAPGGAAGFSSSAGTQSRPRAYVTLITGDRAELATAPDGQQAVNPVLAAGKRAAKGSSGFARFSWAGDQYLVPDEAAAYLASGMLDPRLFDVSYLARANIGTRIPVQVSYTGRAVPRLPGLHVTRATGGAAAGTLASAHALQLGRLLGSVQASALARRSRPGVLPGITRISLTPPSSAPPLPALPAGPAGAAQPAAGAAAPSEGGLAYHTLTLHFTGAKDSVGTAIGFVQNVRNSNLSPGDEQPVGLPGEPGIIITQARGSVSITVPDGTYSAEFSIVTPHAGTFLGYDAALVADPQFTVTSDTAVTLDARTAVPYHVTVSGITAPPVQTDDLGFERTSVTGPASGDGASPRYAFPRFFSTYLDLLSVSGDGYTGSALSASPTAAVTAGKLGFQADTWLGVHPFNDFGTEPKPTYILNFPAQGRIPSSLRYTVAKADLTVYHENLYASPLGTCGHVDWPTIWVAQPQVGSEEAFQYEVSPGGARTDFWYDADPRLDEWQPALIPADCSGSSTELADAPRQIRPGGQINETWNKAPLAAPPPAAPDFGFDAGDQNNPLLTLCPACRQGDNAFVTLTPYGDSNPAHYGSDTPIYGVSNPAFASHLNLYQNGRLAVTWRASCLFLQSGTYCDLIPNGLELPLLHQTASYRLDWSYQDWSYDTVAATTVDWSFRSAPDTTAGRLADGERCAPDPTQGCAYLPLLFISYGLPLNQHGQAPAGQPFPVTFTVSHQQGEAPPSGVSATVSASFNNGKTWTTPKTATGEGGGRFTASISQPASSGTSGFVSLRVTARDRAGDAVTETLIKAYGLTS